MRPVCATPFSSSRKDVQAFTPESARADCSTNCTGPDSFWGRSFRGVAGFEEWVFEDSLSRDAYFGAALGLVSVRARPRRLSALGVSQ